MNVEVAAACDTSLRVITAWQPIKNRAGYVREPGVNIDLWGAKSGATDATGASAPGMAFARASRSADFRRRARGPFGPPYEAKPHGLRQQLR
jgi:hypothetical protein